MSGSRRRWGSGCWLCYNNVRRKCIPLLLWTIRTQGFLAPTIIGCQVVKQTSPRHGFILRAAEGFLFACYWCLTKLTHSSPLLCRVARITFFFSCFCSISFGDKNIKIVISLNLRYSSHGGYPNVRFMSRHMYRTTFSHTAHCTNVVAHTSLYEVI